MSSLTDALEELKEGVENVSTSDLGLENFSTHTLPEVKILSIRQNNRFIDMNKFPKETLNKLNTMLDLMIIRENINKMPKVDYNVAVEVFTMLPIENGKVEEAKLTRTPSFINKTILEKVIDSNTQPKIDPVIVSEIINSKEKIKEGIETVHKILSYLKSFEEKYDQMVLKFEKTPPLVISENKFSDEENDHIKTYNVLETPIAILRQLDDHSFEYEKYKGVFRKKFNELYADETLETVVDSGYIVGMSLNDISISGFRNALSDIEINLSMTSSILDKFMADISSGNSLEVPTKENVDIVIRYNSVVERLITVGNLDAVVDIQDNCFTKILDILEFLD
jgi:hypothetical protein